MGFRERTRICQIGANGGECIGKNFEKNICYNDLCKSTTIQPYPTFNNALLTTKSSVMVDGNWGEWSDWSGCSTCQMHFGFVKRTRQCNNPRPANGGKYCQGLNTQSKSCYESDECSMIFFYFMFRVKLLNRSFR